MKAVLSSHTLNLAVFIPISGWMADRFGTRRVFASAIGLFTAGRFSAESRPISTARRVPNPAGLRRSHDAARGPAHHGTDIRESELIRAMSFVAIPGLIGPMLGPVAGGFIVGHFHWSVIFFVNVPIGLIGLYLVYRHLPDYRDKRTLSFGVSRTHPVRLRHRTALVRARSVW